MVVASQIKDRVIPDWAMVAWALRCWRGRTVDLGWCGGFAFAWKAKRACIRWQGYMSADTSQPLRLFLWKAIITKKKWRLCVPPGTSVKRWCCDRIVSLGLVTLPEREPGKGARRRVGQLEPISNHSLHLSTTSTRLFPYHVLSSMSH